MVNGAALTLFGRAIQARPCFERACRDVLGCFCDTLLKPTLLRECMCEEVSQSSETVLVAFWTA